MKMRKLGGSGLFVSELSFGAMTFGGTDGLWGQVGRLGQDDANTLVQAALEAGINTFDTADVYANGRSEEILGRALTTIGVSRDDVVIATKGFSATGEGPQSSRGVPSTPDQRLPREPAAPRSGSYRPLSGARLRCVYADRGNSRGARHARTRRRCSLRRPVQLGCLADHEGDRHLAGARSRSGDLPAGLLHPGRA